jgi:mannose-1-phosphate guanylyltransferase
MIHPSAEVDPTSIIGPNVVIGADCKIGPGNRLQDSTILSKTTISGYSLVSGSIIGWSNTIGKWVRISGLTVTAEDVQFKDELIINGAMILPHKAIATSYPNAGAVVM